MPFALASDFSPELIAVTGIFFNVITVVRDSICVPGGHCWVGE